jgi:hypothetical protein
VSGALDGLRRDLRASPPAAIASLEASEIETLRGLLVSARERQREALERAVDDGLGFLPRLLRGAVKKALFG